MKAVLKLRRIAALGVIATLFTGCATLRPGSRPTAVETAVQNVCGSSHAQSDSTCVVRDVTRVAHGYRVVIDRRPPAGNDRVAVVVRPAGLLGGTSIEVTQIDTAAAKPRR